MAAHRDTSGFTDWDDLSEAIADRVLLAHVVSHLSESLAIEGIHRRPSDNEVSAAIKFLATELSVDSVIALQAVIAPNAPLRIDPGMNVRVGNYLPPPGCFAVYEQLASIIYCARASGPGGQALGPWRTHVNFEALHPFMDGNGRVGRLLWCWCMRDQGQDPFSLSFLHRFYYQTLEARP